MDLYYSISVLQINVAQTHKNFTFIFSIGELFGKGGHAFKWLKWLCSVTELKDFSGGTVDKNLHGDTGDTDSILGPGRFHILRGN